MAGGGERRPRQCLQGGSDEKTPLLPASKPKLGLSPGTPKTCRREKTELHGSASMEEDDTHGCRRCRLRPQSEQSSHSKHPIPPKVGRSSTATDPWGQASGRSTSWQGKEPGTTSFIRAKQAAPTPPASNLQDLPPRAQPTAMASGAQGCGSAGSILHRNRPYHAMKKVRGGSTG